MEKFLVLVAGGKGARMDNALPKQFIKLLEKEIIFHTIDAFAELINISNIVVVLPADQFSYWEKITEGTIYNSLKVAEGGLTRFDSVKSGLELIPNNVIVGVHDAVRPLVSKRTIKDAYKLAETKGNAVPVIECNQSIRKLSKNTSIALDRTQFKLVQTPQCFLSKILKEAYSKDYQESYTDDASVLEANGQEICLSEGNEDNIKITYPHDLLVAESILKSKKN